MARPFGKTAIDPSLQLTPEERDRLDQIYNNDPIAFMEDLLMIRPKEGGLIPFKLNRAQRRLVELMEQQRKAGKPVRVIILKARQIGFSTVTEAYFCWRLTRNRHLNALVLAHKSDASKNLFRMFGTFVDNLEPEFRPHVRSRNEALGVMEFGTDNPDDQAFDPALGSRIQIETAEDPNAGRSGTYQLVHGSEVAFWPYEETFTALKQAVADKPGTVFVLESTANGASGQFYQNWKLAEAGQSDFIPVFVPWFEHEEYTMQTTATEDEAFRWFKEELDRAVQQGGDNWRAHFKWRSDGTIQLDPEEVDLVRRYGLTYGQIKWRRWAIVNKCDGDIEKFRQEYPANPDEAFLVSGRPFFETIQVIRLKEEAMFAPRPGRFTIDEVASAREQRPVIVPDDWGELFIFANPQPDIQYAIGADVAEGVEDGDNSAAWVLEVKPGEGGKVVIPAVVQGKFDPDVWGRKLYWLGMWYNQALLGVERNAQGTATVQVLEKELMYPNLWGEGWPIWSRIREYGWRTLPGNRQFILQRLKAFVRDGLFEPRFLPMLEEMLAFKWNEKNKPEAERGKHDDLIMAAAIALEMRERAIELVPFAFV